MPASVVKRKEGRTHNQLRPLASEQALLHQADGSASFSHGQTRCLASVFGPGQPKVRKTSRRRRAPVP